MARKLRISFEGAIYHVMARGNGKQAIFLNDRDRTRFLSQLSEQVIKHGIRLYQYCLMDNHFHLLVETPQANISRFMQAFSTAYTMYFNKKHERVGHLFQGRFVSKLVQGNEYLLRLSRYIHLNPIETLDAENMPFADQMEVLQNFRWSSYPAYIGAAKPIEGLEMAPVLALLPGRRSSPAAYRKYIQKGLIRWDDAMKRFVDGSEIAIGNDEFLNQIQELGEEHLARLKRPEDTTFRKQEAPVTPEEIIATVAETMEVSSNTIQRRGREQIARSMAAFLMTRYCRLTQRDIAIKLGLTHGSSVSWQSRKWRRLCDGKPSLRRKLEHAEHRLRPPA